MSISDPDPMTDPLLPLTLFEGFQKIPRLNRDCVITEKIDGTNAQILITDDGRVVAGSRTRLLFPGQADNFGFRAWVEKHTEALRRLGPGRHFGEWWGSGIQRGYGLSQGEKRFSLFAVHRWPDGLPEGLPAGVGLVPVLYRGKFSTMHVSMVLDSLAKAGSAAAPGFMDPEGIIVFHEAATQLFKVTIEGDEAPKGLTVRTKPVNLSKKEESDAKITTAVDSYGRDFFVVHGADGPGVVQWTEPCDPADFSGLPDATGTPE